MNLTSTVFHRLLLNWFDQHGRKNLPWQINKTPYRVWISEIMLQQTQVKTVIPYYQQFMQRFPDVFKLAQAKEDEVLHSWAGLGYYSRARNLHQTAKIVVENHQGTFPHTVQELKALPGIGPSTAGAIAALAFNQSAAILDGNVKRVFSRLHGIREPINEKTVEAKLWDYAIQYLPDSRIADYTQALMDLGALICTRTQAQCHVCPLKQHCYAHRLGIAHLLPVKKAIRSLPSKEATFLVIQANQRIFLQKRPSSGIWGGLWSFPEIEGSPQETAVRLYCNNHFRTTIKEYKNLVSFKHTFTHYHLTIHPVSVKLLHIPCKVMEGTTEIWYNPKESLSIGLPKPSLQILRELS